MRMQRAAALLLAVAGACLVAESGALVTPQPGLACRAGVPRGAGRAGFALRRAGDSTGADGLVEAGAADIAGVTALRGGAGLAKKVGAKNIGLLAILLSLLYLPYATKTCSARINGNNKIQRLGCGPSLAITNVFTLAGIGLVLSNSRSFDRHGRSKFKMRLTGSIIIGLGMFVIIAHAEAARVNWYAKSNVYLGLVLEWWGFVSLFYNFTPRVVAQFPRELAKLFQKLTGKKGGAEGGAGGGQTQGAQQQEVDRLNRWAASQEGGA